LVHIDGKELTGGLILILRGSGFISLENILFFAIRYPVMPIIKQNQVLKTQVALHSCHA
jgi:hypothetical protein